MFNSIKTTVTKRLRMIGGPAALFALAMLPAAAAIPTGVTFASFYDQSKFNFDQPVYIGPVPGEPDGLIVVERAGKIFHLVKNGTGYDKNAWFSVPANVATHWDGAWVVRFHPKFLQNHLFYVMYRQTNNSTRSVIEEWSADPVGLANPHKLRSIIEFNQQSIHSSGDIQFGPDGYLYSSQGDRQVSGQTLNEMWGKVIRIDVDKKDSGLEYSIPADNPFRNVTGTRPEIWAIGFRMPWQISFDKLNGDLWLGDVGDTKTEEINLIQGGKNYAAGVYEGNCTGSDCAKYVNPIFAMDHPTAICFIGGIVYREDPASAFYGVYIWGDYGTKKVYGARLNAQRTGFSENTTIGTAPGNISTFGQDGRGNFYIATYQETGTTTTQLYQMKHAELKPTVTAVIPFANRPINGISKLDPNRYDVYGLDGKLKPLGTELQGASAKRMMIVRDKKTGLTGKWLMP